jgi:hypothetical protein
VRFWREGERTRWDARVLAGQVDVREKSWGPWVVRMGENRDITVDV